MSRDLNGRKIIITGGSKGLGFEIARRFIQEGANVMLCSRNADDLEAAVDELQRYVGDNQRLFSRSADVSDRLAVSELIRETKNVLGGLHVLVNNAGIYGPKGAIEDIDWAEWTRAIEINLYGSVLMTQAVIPHFKSQGYGKIIQLSGGGATNPLPRISAYAVSKAAIVRYAETIAEELRGTAIDVNCIAPGALNTGMLDEILQAGPEVVGKDFYDKSLAQKSEGGVPLAKGVDLAVFLASDLSNGISGKLISAVWDDWKKWPLHLEELSTSDIFTLRRIVQEDRGISWE